jgi:pyrroline-5-carboxylate reductase
MNASLLLGCGNLGQIILRGFQKSNKKVYVLEKNKKIKEKLKKKYNNKLNLINNLKELEDHNLDYVILCVKPNDSIELIKKVNSGINKKFIFISLVAGLNISTIKNSIKSKIIIRMMPNIFVDVGYSSTGIFSQNKSKLVKNKINNDFCFFGTMEWLTSESRMDFFTALYGGGPAYFFYFLNLLIKISEQNGFSKKKSYKLVMTLLYGASKFISEGDYDLNYLIKKVTSKGGTTEKAIKIMEDKKIYAIIEKAIENASLRSKEISEKLK